MVGAQERPPGAVHRGVGDVHRGKGAVHRVREWYTVGGNTGETPQEQCRGGREQCRGGREQQCILF